MIQKRFENIEAADLQALVLNGVSEGRGIEYKQELPNNSDDGKKEFLADVSSFANASGGDLIFGVTEKKDSSGKNTGLPDSADGLMGINPDAEILRLTAIVKDGISRRIPGMQIRHIEGLARGPAILIRVPKSWAAPHMVKYKSSSRFFSRTSAGKFQLDIDEIGAAFMASANLGERIKEFRLDRIGKLLSGNIPVCLEAVPKLVLHLLPVQSFSEFVTADLKAANALWLQNNNEPKPMGRPVRYGPPQFNFSGLISSGGSSGTSDHGFVQLLRNGSIEAVCGRIAGEHIVLGVMFEQELMRSLRPYMDFQRAVGFGPPLFVCISIVSARGFLILPTDPPPPFVHWDFVKEIDQDALLAPEVMIQEDDKELGPLLRPALDMLWQAAGWPGSQGYDGNGKWIGYVR